MSSDTSNLPGLGLLESLPFAARAAAGLVPGHALVHIESERTAIDTETNDMWDNPNVDAFTFSATANIDTVSSAHAADTTCVITIEGLDADFVPVTQTATTNGYTEITLTTPLMRVNNVYQSGGSIHIGNIWVYVNDTSVNGVPGTPANARGYLVVVGIASKASLYTVPAGKTAFLLQAQLHQNNTTKVDAYCRILTNDVGAGVALPKEITRLTVGGAASTGVSRDTGDMVKNYPLPLVINEKNDIYAQAHTYANGGALNFSYDLLLVDNAYLNSGTRQLGTSTVGA